MTAPPSEGRNSTLAGSLAVAAALCLLAMVVIANLGRGWVPVVVLALVAVVFAVAAVTVLADKGGQR